MKNKIIKFITLLILTIIFLLVSLYLLKSNLTTYAIVFITVTALLFIITVASIPREKSAEAEYHSKFKLILKKYDAILAEIGNTPNLEDKNIMLITNIEDMVDAAIEIRKPVYYKKEPDYCIFSLLDNQDMCIYILKQRGDDSTPIEDFINNRKQSIEQKISNSKTQKELMLTRELMLTKAEEKINNGNENKISKEYDLPNRDTINVMPNNLQANNISQELVQPVKIEDDLI